jgi:hypothetical protein
MSMIGGADLGAELGGDIRIIEPDLLLDDALVPDGMEIGFAAWPLDRDQVPAAVIVEGRGSQACAGVLLNCSPGLSWSRSII